MVRIMDCEICGRGEAVAIVLIEGAKMGTCRRCFPHGKLVYNLKDEPAKEKIISTKQQQETEEIVETFGRLIHNKREVLGLPIAVIAERINEKESYLENIERGHLKPTLTVAKKLEKELGVKLIEKVVEEVGSTASPSASKDVTLADFVVIDKKKK